MARLPMERLQAAVHGDALVLIPVALARGRNRAMLLDLRTSVCLFMGTFAMK